MKAHTAEFSVALADWYQKHQRTLPWRKKTMTPYQVWVSEVMLQQTQVSRVAATFYPRFINTFPTLQSLAQSDWESVYPLWRGLGFYRRGKNMLKAARIVEQDFQGQFPQDFAKLCTLPGIGDYTAAAILTFAFNQPVPAIDTNVSKIITTLWSGSEVKKMATQLMEQSRLDPRHWHSAMMDLGNALRARQSLEGTPLAPFFSPTVLEAWKFPPRSGKRDQKILLKTPFSRKSKTNPLAKSRPGDKDLERVEVGAACIYWQGKYLIQTRPEGKTFEGQWEFPGGKRESGEDWRTCVKREMEEELGIEVSVRPHFFQLIRRFKARGTLLDIRFHRCQIQRGKPQALEGQTLRWITQSDFDQIDFVPTNKPLLKYLQKPRRKINKI